jgi:PAS domain S-box-containing protein
MTDQQRASGLAVVTPTTFSSQGPVSILLVDDEPRNLTVLKTVLDDPHYRLVCAESPEQALLALVVEEFALLIIDIQMPGMSGFELAQMVKQRQKTAGVPIIFLTAYYSEDRYVLEGYSTGAVDYLHKPINPIILRSKVAVFAELYRKSSEIARANHSLLNEVAARRRAEEQLRSLNDELERRVAERTAELVQANSALSESQQRLRLALQAGRTGVWTWEFAADRVIWSEECYAIHAVQPGAFEGTFDSFKRLVHEDDRDRVGQSLSAAIEQGELYSCEFRILRPDGEVRWVTGLGIVQRDDLGRPSSMTGTVTDVTDRHAAEQALLQRERELRSLAENTPDILTRFDSDLRFVFVNSAIEKAVGRPRDEFLGRSMRELRLPEDLCHLWERATRRVFETKEQASIEFAYTGPGEVRHYATRLVPERGPSGESTSVLGVTQDVTEQKRAEEALRKADRRKDEFLATLAHELRNPLAPIRNSIEILRLAADNHAVVQTAQATMRRQIEHMVRLIDDLLDVARISSGKITLRKKRVSLRELTETAAEASRPVIEAKGHAFRLTLPQEPILLDVDPTRVAQAFTNLLTNAAKYTPDGGSIELAARRKSGELVVRVVDNGLGIPPGMLTEVFEMFTQVNRTLDRSQGGLGIGLALTRKMVELHGGTISAQSSGLGEGSTFTIRLPCAAPGAGQEEPGTALNAAPNQSPVSTRRVLIVDDSVDGAKSLMYLLQMRGHETRIAHDGTEALNIAREFGPEVVFLDIGLPGMDGYEVLKRLRDEPLSSGALIVALTGWGSDQDKERATQSGFDGHLTKPVEFATIQSLLERLMRSE